jgi:hypothetical protein
MPAPLSTTRKDAKGDQVTPNLSSSPPVGGRPFRWRVPPVVGAFLLFVAPTACKPTPLPPVVCPVGAEWCDCTNGGGCNPGLTCMEGTSATRKDRVCRVPPEGRWLPAQGRAAASDRPVRRPLAQGGARLGQSDLAGLYNGYSGMMNKYIYLTRDNRFLSHKPLWRADGAFDFEASAAKWPDRKGTYRTQTGSIVFLSPAGEKIAPLKQSASGEPTFVYRGVRYSPVRASAVKQLSGVFRSRYSVVASDALPGETLSASASNDITIQFWPDGRFALQKNAVATFRSGHGYSAKSPVNHGTYRVEGPLLKLTFADGTVVEDIFAPLLAKGRRDPNENGFDLGFRIYTRR